ncbi:MAG: SDR family oxidoreductase [Salibacteraceae bacterium]
MSAPIALVTGGNRGIGLAVVRQLAEKGYRVLLGCRNPKAGEKAIAPWPDLAGRIVVEQLDVSSLDSIRSCFEGVQRAYGRLDALVNNAGIHYDTWHEAQNADLQNVRETLETNLFGPWQMVEIFLPLLGQGARVVNVSSGAGALQGMGPGTPGYSVSKAALNVLTLKLAAEWQSKGILVNSVCPGWVRTEMGGAAAPRSVDEGADTIVWAADLPKDGPSGKFFRDREEIPF